MNLFECEWSVKVSWEAETYSKIIKIVWPVLQLFKSATIHAEGTRGGVLCAGVEDQTERVVQQGFTHYFNIAPYSNTEVTTQPVKSLA